MLAHACAHRASEHLPRLWGRCRPTCWRTPAPQTGASGSGGGTCRPARPLSCSHSLDSLSRGRAVCWAAQGARQGGRQGIQLARADEGHGRAVVRPCAPACGVLMPTTRVRTTGRGAGMEHCCAGKRGVLGGWAAMGACRASTRPHPQPALRGGGAWARDGGPNDLNDEPRANALLHAPLFLYVSLDTRGRL